MHHRISRYLNSFRGSGIASMVHCFGYGSNINMTSLAAKGVRPRSSLRARLPGWRLTFNVHHWFQRLEGGVGNILPTGDLTDEVRGVMHVCDDEDLAKLDAVESYGVGYDRIEVELETEEGPAKALAYVGIESYLDDRCRPTQRYLNIIVRGAEAAGIDADYIAKLRATPVHQPPDYPPFRHPETESAEFDAERLAAHPRYTAVFGAVFDMAEARWQHHCLWELFGGRDTTLFHLRRHDDSHGSESLDDLRHDRLTEGQRAYLNAYIHEYAAEYRYVGRYQF